MTTGSTGQRPRFTLAAVVVVTSATPLAVDALTAGETAQYAALPGGQRRRGWLTARHALRRALAIAGLATDTSLLTFPSAAASISHSGELAAAAVVIGGKDSICGVGIDVEVDRTPHPHGAPYFLTDDEQAGLSGVPREEDRLRELLRLWTVKEALFKSDPTNAETVLRDYATASPSALRGRAVRLRDGSRSADFSYTSSELPRGFISAAVTYSKPWKGNPMKNIEFDEIAKHISSLVSVPAARLTPEMTIAELAPDSFTLVEVAVDLQEEFDVILSQMDFKDLRTLGDLVELMRVRASGSHQATP